MTEGRSYSVTPGGTERGRRRGASCSRTAVWFGALLPRAVMALLGADVERRRPMLGTVLRHERPRLGHAPRTRPRKKGKNTYSPSAQWLWDIREGVPGRFPDFSGTERTPQSARKTPLGD